MSEAERDQLAAAVARQDAWAWVLDDPRGRLVLAELLRQSGPLAASMAASDPLATAYREGQRSVGLLIYDAAMQMRANLWPRLHLAMLTGDETARGKPFESHSDDAAG